MLPIIPVLLQMCCFLNYRNEEGVWVMIPVTSGSHGSIALFEKEDMHENPEHSDVSDEVSDECIQIFLSTFCQCSLGANNPVLFCFRVAVSVLILLTLLSQRSSSLPENIFVSSLHIEKKRLFNQKCHLRNNGCPRCPWKNKILATQQNSTFFSATCCQLHRKLLSKREGLTLTGRVLGYKSFRIKLLPIPTTKAELWRSPKEAAGAGEYTVLEYTKVVRTWNQFLSFVKIMQPSTDLCHT